MCPSQRIDSCSIAQADSQKPHSWHLSTAFLENYRQHKSTATENLLARYEGDIVIRGLVINLR